MRPTVTINKNNQKVLDRKENNHVWEEYMEELFDDDRPPLKTRYKKIYISKKITAQTKFLQKYSNVWMKKASQHCIKYLTLYMRQVTTPHNDYPIHVPPCRKKCEDHRLA